jgi:hypothetical protein
MAQLHSEPPRGHFKNGSPYVETATTRQARVGRGRCQVCKHPERIRIEALHVGGVTLDALAAEFGCQRDAIHRHCKFHVSKIAKINYLAGPTQIATLAQAAARENKSILEYLSVIRSILMAQLVKQAEKGNALTAGRISGYLTTVLQTLGKITGEISGLASATLTINNSVHVLKVSRSSSSRPVCSMSVQGIRKRAPILSICFAGLMPSTPHQPSLT